MNHLEGGNHFDKHHSGNPAARFLMRKFHDCLVRLVSNADPRRVLDAGCGEGYTTRFLEPAMVPGGFLVGMDRAPRTLRIARRSCPEMPIFAGSAGDLPLPDGAFDLVIACELLEHLERPRSALQEFRRVSRGLCLFSVPWEPTWRILNLTRGAYWKDWGNTPGHINHWSRNGFLNFLKPHFSTVTIHPCWTWTFALCRK